MAGNRRKSEILMRGMKKSVITVALLSILLYSSSVSAGSYQWASVKIQSALFIKVLGFNKALEGNLIIYVLGADEFAGEFRTQIGNRVGDGRLYAVIRGERLPADVPDIVYIGEGCNLEKVLDYTERNRVMSISGNPGYVGKGVSLIIAIEDGKPRLIVDTESSIREGVEWNKQMIRISQIY